MCQGVRMEVKEQELAGVDFFFDCLFQKSYLLCQLTDPASFPCFCWVDYILETVYLEKGSHAFKRLQLISHYLTCKVLPDFQPDSYNLLIWPSCDQVTWLALVIIFGTPFSAEFTRLHQFVNSCSWAPCVHMDAIHGGLGAGLRLLFQVKEEWGLMAWGSGSPFLLCSLPSCSPH